MSYQTTLHFDSSALLIVKPEIDQTLTNLENGIGGLLEDGVLPFGMDDTLVSLEQCSHVLRLLEQPDLAELMNLLSQVSKKVIQDAQNQQLQDHDVGAISESSATIRRYLDFLCMQETHIPQFLTAATSSLQQALKLPMMHEGAFVMPFIRTLRPDIHLDPVEAPPASDYVHQLYRLSLLHILQKKARPLDYQALRLCGQYAASRAQGSAMAQYWGLVQIVLDGLDGLLMTEPRQRVLIRIEQQLGTVMQSPDSSTASAEDYADVMSLVLARDHEVAHMIRQQLNIGEDVLSDNELRIYSRQLYGPDLETIRTVVDLLTGQINAISARVETGQHVRDPEIRQKIQLELTEVAAILDVIQLTDAAGRIRFEAEQMHGQQDLANRETADHLMSSLQFASNALQILQRNYSPLRIKLQLHNPDITFTKIQDAQRVLCDEARATLQIIQDQMSQPGQQQYPEIADMLREVSGALMFMDAPQGHRMLQKAADLLQQVSERGIRLNRPQLQLLATTIMSTDYFIEQRQSQQPVMPLTLQTGEQSIDQLAQMVA